MFNKQDPVEIQEENSGTDIKHFNISLFDDFAHLAKNKPAEFEALRTRLCNELIQSAPKRMRKRLEGLQFIIDMERRRKNTSLSACLKLSCMMNDSLQELKEALSNPQAYLTHKQGQESADIIPLFQNA